MCDKREILPKVLRVRLADKYQLTEREIEVWQLIAEGLDQKSVADAINLSKDTVFSHRKSLYRKIGLSDQLGVSKNVLATILLAKELEDQIDGHPKSSEDGMEGMDGMDGEE